MKNIFYYLILATIFFTLLGCEKENGGCGCVPPPPRETYPYLIHSYLRLNASEKNYNVYFSDYYTYSSNLQISFSLFNTPSKTNGDTLFSYSFLYLDSIIQKNKIIVTNSNYSVMSMKDSNLFINYTNKYNNSYNNKLYYVRYFYLYYSVGEHNLPNAAILDTIQSINFYLPNTENKNNEWVLSNQFFNLEYHSFVPYLGANPQKDWNSDLDSNKLFIMESAQQFNQSLHPLMNIDIRCNINKKTFDSLKIQKIRMDIITTNGKQIKHYYNIDKEW